MMNMLSLRNGFWMALALTVLVGSIFDFIALRQSNITDATGEMVILSYQVINETNRTAQDFERLQQSFNPPLADPMPLLRSLKNHVAKLQNLSMGNPAQQKEVAHLNSLLQLEENHRVQPLPPEQRSLVRQSLDKIDETEESILENRLESDRIQNNNARIQVLLASIVDILLLATLGVVWVLYARHRRQTEKTLTEAIQSISKANFELEQASLSKTHLLKATAHDLRNPLGSIQGLAELISEETTHPTVTELTDIIRQVSEQTLGLVNQLVDPKALITGKPTQQVRDFDMLKCLEDVCLSQQPLALRKNQTIKIESGTDPLIMRGDAGKIWDLFINLTGNAIKFSPLGGEIRLRAFKKNDSIVVEVEDQGPGISQEDRARAFKKYQRLGAQPTGGEASSGLGLYLVKEIVDAHDGTIEILAPREGTGARFVVSLPVSLPRRVSLNPGPSIGI
jgi:signal transduction histidine kinase